MINAYKTCDGRYFDSHDEALDHEAALTERKRNSSVLDWTYCECGCHCHLLNIAGRIFECFQVEPIGTKFRLAEGHRSMNHKTLGTFDTWRTLETWLVEQRLRDWHADLSVALERIDGRE